MGVYLRKSVRVGPFRFNLSKSGVGVSAGFKGLRVGTGPRGNYVHMGVGGIYYRTTIPSSTKPRHDAEPAHRQPQQTHSPRDPTLGRTVEIASADATQIVDSTSRDLIDELNTKHQMWQIWPVVATGFALVLGFGLANSWPSWLLVILILIAATGISFAYIKDDVRKSTVMLYELDSNVEAAYGRVIDAMRQLGSCTRTWHVEASTHVNDRKYHAGADSLLRRKSLGIRNAAPKFLKTNIETYALDFGSRRLHFFPDRLFIYDSSGIGAISYRELNVDVSATQFIESDRVPSDAQVVDRTWRYVNKGGGPDRRFKNNPQIPICLYEKIRIQSGSGINEEIQLSRTGQGQYLKMAVASLVTTS